MGPKSPYYEQKTIKKTDLQKISLVQNMAEEIPSFYNLKSRHLKGEIPDGAKAVNGVLVNSVHAMKQLLLKTELGNISTGFDLCCDKKSHLHKLELEDCGADIF